MAQNKAAYWLTDEGLILLQGWARDGLTDEQISHNCGISRSTLGEWKKKYVPISDTLKEGKEIVDRCVENALYKRAIGYEYDEVTKELVNGSIQVTKIVRKQVLPDVAAGFIWLKNRKPKQWRDRPEDTDKNEAIQIILKRE